MVDGRTSYVVAARRTALGRIGGLHSARRLEQLAAPVVEAVLDDAGVSPDRVDELIIGNALHGGNPARLIALASGLPEHVAAVSVDRQCASGLDAILTACRKVEAGDAHVILAGGAESLSTAPWRIAKPRNLYQIPHFIGVEPGTGHEHHDPQGFEASEALSRKLGISREQQDAWAAKSHMKAEAARDARRFKGEIVPLRGNADEARDQGGLTGADLDDFKDEPSLVEPEGTLTGANTSAMHDGAAMVLVVSQHFWEELGKPRAMRLVSGTSHGVGPQAEAEAPIAVMKKLYGKLNGFNPKHIGTVEISETSAAQAIAFGAELGLDDDIINRDGGAVVRGHPFAAAGAVLVVRLFTQMVRQGEGVGIADRPKYGVATLGAIGGLGQAGLFEVV